MKNIDLINALQELDPDKEIAVEVFKEEDGRLSACTYDLIFGLNSFGELVLKVFV